MAAPAPRWRSRKKEDARCLILHTGRPYKYIGLGLSVYGKRAARSNQKMEEALGSLRENGHEHVDYTILVARLIIGSVKISDSSRLVVENSDTTAPSGPA